MFCAVYSFLLLYKDTNPQNPCSLYCIATDHDWTLAQSGSRQGQFSNLFKVC